MTTAAAGKLDARGNPAKSAAPSRVLRLCLWLHRWTSVLATLPFLILCLSGTVLIFHEEIDLALGVIPPAPGLVSGEQALADSVSEVLRANPDNKMGILGIDPEEHPGLLLLGTLPKSDSGFRNMKQSFAYIETGELTADSHNSRETLTGFLFELHAEWFLGTPGALLGAFIALLVLVSLLSGLVVYWPHARRVAFAVFRKGRGQRLYQLDLHNFIGVIVTGWALVVTLTGFLLGFGSIVTAIWAQSQLKADITAQAEPSQFAGAAIVDADTVYRTALQAAPVDWSVTSIVWPDTDFTSAHNYAVLITGSGLNQRLFRIVLVDAFSGALIRVVELPWYMKTLVLSQPLHFGDYGGVLLKLLWTLCTWLTLFITANGAWLWWHRKYQRRSRRSSDATITH